MLIVDDEAFNHYSLGLLLKTKFDLEHDCAFDGSEAIQKIVQNQDLYRLVIMDMNMPVLDGMEATLKLRKLAT